MYSFPHLSLPATFLWTKTVLSAEIPVQPAYRPLHPVQQELPLAASVLLPKMPQSIHHRIKGLQRLAVAYPYDYQIPEAGMDVPSLTATAGLHNDNFLSQ